MEEHPAWPKDVKPKIRYRKLNKDLKVEVVVIGGGLTGVLTAYLLSKSGKKVALIEKKKLGDGATEYTTAFITEVIDTDLQELNTMYGTEKAKLIWQSGNDAIDLIEEIVKKEKIECEFKRCSAFIYASSENDIKNIKKTADLAQELGFKVKFSKDKKLNFENFGNLEIKNQAKFHPLKFLSAVAQKANDNGVMIFEESEVLEVVGDNPVIVRAEHGEIKAHYAVIATYEPLGNPIELMLKNGLYISYVLEANIIKGKIPEGIYWDIESPYHYFRIDSQKNYDRLIIGGEDHRLELKIDPKKNYKALDKYLKSILKGIKYEIVRKWKGPIMETIDGLPYIGRLARNDYQLVATGFSGNGMTYAALAASIFNDIIMGNKNKWISLYNAKRLPTIPQLIRKGIDYSKVFYGGAIKNFFG